MSSFRLVLSRAAVGALLILPAAAQAQRALPSALAPSAGVGVVAPMASVAPVAPVAGIPAVSPIVAETIAAPAAVDRSAALNMAPRDHADVGPNVGLMIIGGAAIITGALVEGRSGAIISVAGAVVGLYGLYRYLR